jgi:hypothetical protein
MKYRHLKLHKRSNEKKILPQHFIGQDTGNHITAVKIAALDKPGIKYTEKGLSLLQRNCH